MSVTEIRKTKQKWSLNPRGKAWTEDSNKVGQKMLEKMGWSRGKGLGAKENGVKEPLRVSYKNDTQGMGFEETDGQWTEHDSNYNALLQSLSGQKDSETEIKISSLEEKSQNSKVRVHYKKFTRGKDLSRCSEKDLASIFGKKSLKATPTKTEDKEKETELSNSGFLHNGGSMVDYFKKKLPNFSKFGSPGVGRDSESEGESRGGFGLKTPDKKRKLSEETVDRTPKKMKNEDEDHIGLSNPAFDPLFNNIEVQKHVLNTIAEEEGEEVEKNTKVHKIKENGFEDSVDSSGSKKKKRNREESASNNEEEEVKKKKKKKNAPVNGVEELDDNSESPKKKKKKCTTAMENPNFNDGEGEDGYVDETFEVKRKKKKSKDAVDSCQDSILSENFEVKRKKKSKDNSKALINPVFDGESGETSYVNENFEVKRKKKNKQNLAIDNPNFNDLNCEESTNNNEFEVKRKKKKKNKLALDNPSFNDAINEDPPTEDVTNKECSEPKTKKKRKKETDNAIQSVSTSEADPINDPNVELMLNVTSTPTVVEEVNESKQSSTVKRRKSVRFSGVNEERIIPNKDAEDIELRNALFDINSKVISNSLKEAKGTSNLGFNRSQVMLDENINEMSKKIDGFQAEIENDMNEAKFKARDRGPRQVHNAIRQPIGRTFRQPVGGTFRQPVDRTVRQPVDRTVRQPVGRTVRQPVGQTVKSPVKIGKVEGCTVGEKLPDGTKLYFKYAKFGRTPVWRRNDQSVGFAKKSYKHLIRDDIILDFNNTNLHKVVGYAVDIE